jgi:hypothetical protein
MEMPGGEPCGNVSSLGLMKMVPETQKDTRTSLEHLKIAESPLIIAGILWKSSYMRISISNWEIFRFRAISSHCGCTEVLEGETVVNCPAVSCKKPAQLDRLWHHARRESD